MKKPGPDDCIVAESYFIDLSESLWLLQYFVTRLFESLCLPHVINYPGSNLLTQHLRICIELMSRRLFNRQNLSQWSTVDYSKKHEYWKLYNLFFFSMSIPWLTHYTVKSDTLNLVDISNYLIFLLFSERRTGGIALLSLVLPSRRWYRLARKWDKIVTTPLGG